MTYSGHKGCKPLCCHAVRSDRVLLACGSDMRAVSRPPCQCFHAHPRVVFFINSVTFNRLYLAQSKPCTVQRWTVRWTVTRVFSVDCHACGGPAMHLCPFTVPVNYSWEEWRPLISNALRPIDIQASLDAAEKCSWSKFCYYCGIAASSCRRGELRTQRMGSGPELTSCSSRMILPNRGRNSHPLRCFIPSSSLGSASADEAGLKGQGTRDRKRTSNCAGEPPVKIVHDNARIKREKSVDTEPGVPGSTAFVADGRSGNDLRSSGTSCRSANEKAVEDAAAACSSTRERNRSCRCARFRIITALRWIGNMKSEAAHHFHSSCCADATTLRWALTLLNHTPWDQCQSVGSTFVLRIINNSVLRGMHSSIGALNCTSRARLEDMRAVRPLVCEAFCKRT